MAPAWSLSGIWVTSALPDQNLSRNGPSKTGPTKASPPPDSSFASSYRRVAIMPAFPSFASAGSLRGNGVLQARGSRLTIPGVIGTGGLGKSKGLVGVERDPSHPVLLMVLVL